MMRLIFIFTLLGLLACKDNASQESRQENISSESPGAIAAEAYFSEVREVLEADSADFWGIPLYGPILLVDTESRIFYSNVNNEKNELGKVGNVFMDTLPETVNIANTAIDWYGKRWTMLLKPLPEDRFKRNTLIIHELFHRIQPELGFGNIKEQSNAHLDTKEGRILLKLELEALKKALQVENKAKPLKHLRNAMVFRSLRYTKVDIKEAENALELNEGLAEYTGVLLSLRDNNEVVTHLVGSIERFYENPSFVRSFAYQTVPAYGYLLSSIDKNWHLEISASTNLTDYFLRAFKIELPQELNALVENERGDYGYAAILQQENRRELERQEMIARYKAKFVTSPHFKLKFQNMNISFDPSNLVPLAGYGTVYPSLRVTDNWGILQVSEGALLSQNWDFVILSPPTQIMDTLVIGEGWELKLNRGWKVKKEEGNFEVLRAEE